MAPIWKGAINFGLINVPIKLTLGTKRENPAFRSLHKDCGTPINQKRFCQACNREVAYDELAKGYEYEKGKFVVINEEDLEGLPIKSTKYIQLIDFINIAEVDPIYFEKTYFLAPEASGEKSYLILYSAMKKSGKAAIGKITIREKENLCLVRVYEDTLALNTMFFADEVRASQTNIDKIEQRTRITQAEQQLAEQIIENLSAPFEIAKYHDEYREELKKLIQAKIEGEEIVQPKLKMQDEHKFADLLERLKASVEATKNTGKGEKKQEEAKKKPKKAAK